MKNINKLSILLFLILGVVFTSCETTELDLLDDPNDVTLDKAELDRYMVAIQVDFKSFVEQMGRNGGQLSRIEYMFGRTYATNFSDTSTDNEWLLAYQRMFSDMVGAELLATGTGDNKHIGVMRVIKAYTLMTLVDFYGDVPYSEATNPSEFPFPNADDDAAVYQSALALLDEAIEFLNAEGENLENDFFYANDFTKWEKLANTLKMRAYLNTRLVDSDAQSKFNAIVNTGNFISDASGAEDFQFRYGNNVSGPDTRHPAYSADYTITGAGRYRSNWLMDLMVQNDDPRRFYYFYRQAKCTPGADDCTPSTILLFCSNQSAPQHYPSTMIFCNVERGYWGRDHGDAAGIPPDGLLRTVAGIYPAGGKFDMGANRDGTIELNLGEDEDDPSDDFYEFVYDETNNSAGETGGILGAGVTPIVLASSVDFWRAEFALANGQSVQASNFVNSAITKSLTKITNEFSNTLDPEYDGNLLLDNVIVDPLNGDIIGPLDPDTGLLDEEIIRSASLLPTSEELNAFATAQANLITNTSDSSWNVLAEQFFTNQYGNGIDTYNFYRRTGYPKTLQFNLESSGGNFVRSFLYPAVEANTNDNITQKENVDTQVFWDNNPSSPGFPFSN